MTPSRATSFLSGLPHCTVMLFLCAVIIYNIPPRFFGCGLPFPAKLEGCRVLDLGSGSGRDCYAFSKLVGPSGHVTGIDMTEELVITHACTHTNLQWISVLSSDTMCISLDRSISSVHWVSSKQVWLQGAQRHLCPGVHGEARWSWHTEGLNGCCTVGLKHGYDLSMVCY